MTLTDYKQALLAHIARVTENAKRDTAYDQGFIQALNFMYWDVCMGVIDQIAEGISPKKIEEEEK